MTIITRTPTTLVTGFLGAGKTTFINRLLAHKGNATWAILVNEFGKIGIDGKLFDSQDVAIKEVSGGCICCTSQLSLHIAIARLLADHQPDHLIIEPTGLAHADELTEQLTAPHWQTSLAINAIICIINAAQWIQPNYRTHDGYMAHVKYADIIAISQTDTLNDDDKSALHAWITAINPHATIIDTATTNPTNLTKLLHAKRTNAPHPTIVPLVKYSPLSVPRPTTQTSDTDTAPPYRYHESMAQYHVGGWRLPADWLFDGHGLQRWLLALTGYLRIKGVIHCQEGWLRLNITPTNISISDTDPQDDSRLELILNQTADWQSLDEQLMGLMLSK